MAQAPTTFDAKSFLQNLTRQPGVYQMYSDTGDILYVGKAKNLRNRVASYFRSSGISSKTQALVKRIASIEVTITPSEAEALVLEHNLIKAQKPPYNILLRDDKSFPYVYLSEGEKHPRLALHRGPKKNKGRYFGPYPNAGAVRESLNFLQKVFGVRQCEDSVYRNRTRPCLLFQIGRCSGPCVERVSEGDYAEDVQHTAMFLEGRSELLNQRLEQEMDAASQALAFEKAAAYRDRIASLRQVQAQQIIESGEHSMDVVACECEAGASCVHVLYVRQGRIMGSKSYFPKDKLESDAAATLRAFLAHNYLGGSAMDTPLQIIVSQQLDDAEVIAQAVNDACGKSVKIIANVRTYKAKWLAMAIQAARSNLQGHLNHAQTLLQRFEALQLALDTEEVMTRIECFDISHSSGEKTVASCVVFERGGALKSDYRRFNIDGITPGDDYAAMEQALNRRYSRLQKEAKKMPDLLLIDGGAGQLGKARAVLAELGIDDIYLVGVAKGTTRKPGFETLVFADGSERVLDSDNSALHLIQQVRDEAHRFAITGHKQRRDVARKTSTLEAIEGVGPKRRKALLQYFGGLQEVMRAGVDDLAKVPGINKKTAQHIYSALHSE
ncbi:MAG: excinuclease ABC subunit UvrC [Cellvibrionaceae bacterium]|nr:excinuclease ABC subunit UvrC [Cellvibrionaceae bacterium]